jgi:hypothetical protein
MIAGHAMQGMCYMYVPQMTWFFIANAHPLLRTFISLLIVGKTVINITFMKLSESYFMNFLVCLHALFMNSSLPICKNWLAENGRYGCKCCYQLSWLWQEEVPDVLAGKQKWHGKMQQAAEVQVHSECDLDHVPWCHHE